MTAERGQGSSPGLAHPLQGVLQQLDGAVDGLLRNVGGFPVALDLQHCHLQREKSVRKGRMKGRKAQNHCQALKVVFGEAERMAASL